MKPRLPVRRAILERRTYEAPAEGRAGKIRLDFNENTTGCSHAARKALARVSAKEWAMYPEYEAPTRVLAKYFRVRPEELALTNGGDDALRVFFDTFVEPGSSILICEPTFPMYRYYAEIAGARISALTYGSRMEFPLQATLKALRKKPRVFFLANPNNPTGTLVNRKAILQILRAATHTVVVLDEAYSDFSGLTFAAEVRKFPRLFVAKTFSKAAGMAGLRLGAVIAQRDSLAFVRRSMPPFPVNQAALVAAVAAIQEASSIKKYVATVKVLRSWLVSQLQERGVVVFPAHGNFLLADFGPAGTSLFKKLAASGILVRKRGEIGPGFVRISIGNRQELQKLLNVIDGNK